ncbi:hypothetical protein PCO85_00625 [Prodigiosinella aquatilis]|nr:hypothetical protein [Prodigiosinella sp. LS101]WJV54033.1 hypothetical protein PCO85_00625 [Prodigiosinella sp. LS101]WJV58394.1 hypothetical protein PCO84_00630 [Pectobacteriaceae bacterium C111]
MSVKELDLEFSEYTGGIAIWPAYPAVFSTVKVENDPNLKPGIHVHARYKKGGMKIIDDTFDRVNIKSLEQGNNQSFSLDYSMAKNFLVANLLGKKISSVKCQNCGSTIENELPHIVGENKGECHHCNSTYRISNEIFSTRLKDVFTSITALTEYPPLKLKTHVLNLDLDKYCGGVSLMTCCRAIVWTGGSIEEDGIHVHGYDNTRIRFDSTVGRIVIGEMEILPEYMKMLSIQNYLKLRIETTYCNVCGTPHFDKYEDALEPTSVKHCEVCKTKSNTKYVISNPIIDVLSKLNILKDKMI